MYVLLIYKILSGKITREHITAYTAKAEGIRNEHPISLKEINFHISIESEDIIDSDLALTVKQAETISPVWLAIKNNVTVNVTYEIKSK